MGQKVWTGNLENPIYIIENDIKAEVLLGGVEENTNGKYEAIVAVDYDDETDSDAKLLGISDSLDEAKAMVESYCAGL